MRYLGNKSELLASLGLNSTGAVTYRRRNINGNFAINQDGSSGSSTTYAAGVYVFDGWKAGANGVTLSWSAGANGDVTVTITAGTLLQVIEGKVYLPEGGAYTLSQATGMTAQARIYQGSATGAYATLPLTTSGLTAGTNAVIEFSTGTLSRVQLEPGTAATLYEYRDDELRRAQRYYEIGVARYNGYGQVNVPEAITIPFKEVKRAAPSVTFANLFAFNVNGSATVGDFQNTASDFFYTRTPTNSNGLTVWSDSWAANCRL